MDEFSSSAASRRLWSKALQRKKVGGRPHRRDPVVTLPALARRPSGSQHADASRTSLHAFLAAQLDANDRESYSRSQLRVMASSRLQPTSSNNLVATSSRTHSTERLTPLDPASFEKTRAPQRRPLPGPLQAAINEVLAERIHDELPSDREDRWETNNNKSDESPVVPTAKRSSPSKKQLYGRRPEWRRYIRRIMMTNGIRGSTLARYRRLVGIVARKSLAQSLAGAAERVLRYRLEARSATTIQRMALRFLVRRRQANAQRRHRAAARIQSVWKKLFEIERQRKLAEEARQATIERLTRACAARVVQRGYRNYRRSCRLREDERRQQQHASMLQRARLKLLHRYQSWRHNSTKDNLSYSEAAVSIPLVNSEQKVCSDVSSSGERDELRPQGVHCGNAEVVGSSATSNAMACNGDREDTPHQQQQLAFRQEPAASISPALGDNDERVDSEIRFALFSHDQPPEKVEKEALPAAASLVEDNQQEHSDAPEGQAAPPSCTQVCMRATQGNTPRNLLKAERQDDADYGSNNADTEEEASVPLSSPAEPPQTLVDVVDDTSAARATALAVAVAVRTRQTAAGKIARSLAPTVEARHKLKTSAAVRIQCLVRSHLARQCMARVRLEALLTLREQLRASWKRQAFKPQTSSLDNREVHDDQGPENDDEDEEVDLEVGRYQPSLAGASETYLHLLPTRNGQIPPGVPLLQASAGAPVLALWKWSWPDKKWLSTSQ